MLTLAGKLLFLEVRVRRHAGFAVVAGKLEHAEVERVEPGQCDELEFVSHTGQLGLEAGNGLLVQLLAPIE